MPGIRRNDRGGWYTSRRTGRRFNYAEPRGLMVAGVDERSVTIHHGFVPFGKTSPFETLHFSRTFRGRLERGLERLPLPGKRINAHTLYYADGGPSSIDAWDYTNPADDPDPNWWETRKARALAAMTPEQRAEYDELVARNARPTAPAARGERNGR